MKNTVASLREIAKRADAPINSRMVKADIVNAIMVKVELDHTRAIEDDKEMYSLREDEYMLPIGNGESILLDGYAGKMMNYHMKGVRRFNPSERRDKNGAIVLTPRQRRRIHKNDRTYAKKIGLSV